MRRFFQIGVLSFVGIFLLSSFSLRRNSCPENFKKISDSPLVYTCDQFLSDEECEHLIEIAKPSLARSTVVDLNSLDNQLDSRRTSLGMFLPYNIKDETVKRIEKRIAKVTAIPRENGENMQILYYGVGAEYQPHFDYFDPDTVGGLAQYNRGGQRVATLMVYLNTPKQGGETIFPRVGLKVVPKKGKALLFYSVDAEGNSDPMSFHGGAPVLMGEKWVVTRWLREGVFH